VQQCDHCWYWVAVCFTAFADWTRHGAQHHLLCRVLSV
jgi:hypothetical protein